MIKKRIGFIGLGNMGSALAANLVKQGHDIIAHDALGPDRAPAGSNTAASVSEVALNADMVVFSLPDGQASGEVSQQIVETVGTQVTHVIDTSTIGVTAAQRIGSQLAEQGVAYIDAPVSGGVAGARARTLMVMYAGSDDACLHVEPVLRGLSDRRHRVGDQVGLAQAMKLANNFLSAIALAATSEAIAFGIAAGLDMGTMLEVLNSSSGHNSATRDKFPNQILNGRYEAGFANSLMLKDMDLYMQSVDDRGRTSPIGALTASIWRDFVATEPGADFTRIFPFIEHPAT